MCLGGGPKVPDLPPAPPALQPPQAAVAPLYGAGATDPTKRRGAAGTANAMSTLLTGAGGIPSGALSVGVASLLGR
jgi:hypothetical protein